MFLHTKGHKPAGIGILIKNLHLLAMDLERHFAWSWPQAADISVPLLARMIAVKPPSIRIC